jgi:hypothetical protein
MDPPRPLLRKVDGVHIPVPDLVLLDLSKGTFITDDDGNVTGVG